MDWRPSGEPGAVGAAGTGAEGEAASLLAVGTGGTSGRGGSAARARATPVRVDRRPPGRTALAGHLGAAGAHGGTPRLPHFLSFGRAVPGSIGWLRGPLKGACHSTFTGGKK